MKESRQSFCRAFIKLIIRSFVAATSVLFISYLIIPVYAAQTKTDSNQPLSELQYIAIDNTHQLSQARAVISQAIDETDFSDDSRLLIEQLMQRAAIDQQVGANIAALQDLQFAFRLASSTNQQDLSAKVAQRIALIHQARSEHAIAISYAQQAIKQYEQQNLEQELTEALLINISSLVATEQIETATEQLQKVLSYIKLKASKPLQATYFRLLGELELKKENIQSSLDALNTAQQLTSPSNYSELAALKLLSSKAYTTQQNMDAAISSLVSAFELANQHDVSFFLHQSLQLQRAFLLSQLNEYEAAYNVMQSIIKDRELAQPISEIKRMLDMHANFQLNLQQQENADLKEENQWKSSQIETKQTLSRLYLLIMALLFCLSSLLLLLFIRGRKHRRRLERIAHTDQLTNLHSRTRVFELLKYHQELFGRSKQSYCVAVLDLDYFKRINDSYGHQMGDEVLRRFGLLCQEKFRQTDIIGRIGGEEFLFILPSTQYKQAIEVFVQFNKNLLTIGKQLNIEQATTASVGLVMPTTNESILSIVKRADDALYQAKANGRCCVVYGNNLSALQKNLAKVN